ncbi:unnamed protein product, partial [marine sediment metagenome]
VILKNGEVWNGRWTENKIELTSKTKVSKVKNNG